MSQSFFKCPSFCFIKSRKNVSKIHLKFPFFSNKIKTKAYIQNLRHRSLQGNAFDISERFQYQLYNIKQEILGQKLKVKKNDKNLLS